MIRIIILATYVIIISGLSLIPAGSLPISESKLFPHADKLVHFSMYAGLTFLLFYCSPEKFKGRNKQFIPLIIVLVWGTLMELLQYISGFGRNFSQFDIAANTLGFFPGWLAYKWLLEDNHITDGGKVKEGSEID